MNQIHRPAIAALTSLLVAVAGAPLASADDSVHLVDNANPNRVTAFPIGSTAVGPVNAYIDALVLDAGDVTAILDHVALLAGVHGPIN